MTTENMAERDAAKTAPTAPPSAYTRPRTQPAPPPLDQPEPSLADLAAGRDVPEQTRATLDRSADDDSTEPETNDLEPRPSRIRNSPATRPLATLLPALALTVAASLYGLGLTLTLLIALGGALLGFAVATATHQWGPKAPLPAPEHTSTVPVATPLFKRLPLRMRAILGHRLSTASTVQAWYAVRTVSWSARTKRSADAYVTTTATQLAKLTGRNAHIRVTSRPFAYSVWAKKKTANAPDRIPAFRDHLLNTQAYLALQGYEVKTVYIGLDVLRRGPLRAWLASVSPRLAVWEARSMERAISDTDKIVAGAGLKARPVSSTQMKRLLARSIALGIPASLGEDGEDMDGAWDREDLAVFEDLASKETERPGARTVIIHGTHNGNEITKHLAVGVFEKTDLGTSDLPFLQKKDLLPFPVEVSVRFKVLDPTATRREHSRLASRVMSQLKHYAEHNLDAPVALIRQRSVVAAMADELRNESGGTSISQRTQAWVTLVVAGDTEEEAVARLQEVANLYAPSIVIKSPKDKHAWVQSFIPGEMLPSHAYMRRMPVYSLAGGVPNAGVVVGDNEGTFIGHTSGTTLAPVLSRQHRRLQKKDASGVTILACKPGAGKTSLAGLFIHDWVCDGIQTIVLDPSARLEALTRLPEFAGYARSTNVLDAPDGALSTYGIIQDPQREHYESDRLWNKAMDEAKALRRSLTLDVMLRLLPPSMRYNAKTESVLNTAVQAVGAKQTNSINDVLRQMVAPGTKYRGWAVELEAMLKGCSATRIGTLMFPPMHTGDGDSIMGLEPKLLECISLKGAGLPPDDLPEVEWTSEMRMAKVLLDVSAAKVLRFMYEGDPNRPKSIVMDEIDTWLGSNSGRQFITVGARDTRKHSTILFLIGQTLSTILRAKIGNLIGAAFIGLTEDPDDQAAAVRIMQLPAEHGYEAELATLQGGGETDYDADDETAEEPEPIPFREFMMWETDRPVNRISVTLDHLTDPVREAINSRGDAKRARRAMWTAYTPPTDEQGSSSDRELEKV